MPQQKGMKRARKVLARKQRIAAADKKANIRRVQRQDELAANAVVEAAKAAK
ncbi:MAG TPA: hypothetical protein V6C81_10270 [Planktothrix sp.]|jgi:hypothetical protein